MRAYHTFKQRKKRGRKMKKVLAAVAMLAVMAAAGSADAALYISQIYGGGGASTGTPTYNHDYVELYNNGTVAIDVTGWSIQYASATGSFGTTNSHTLSGIVAANSYYLIQESNPPGIPGTAGANLPVTPNYNGQLNLSASAGKVALVNSATVVSGTGSTGGYVDLIGYGSTANFNNGKALTANLNNMTAVFQANNGTLSIGAPTPHASDATPTPIPAAAWLLGSGLMGLMGIRRRKI
jgi:hypothetical protein